MTATTATTVTVEGPSKAMPQEVPVEKKAAHVFRAEAGPSGVMGAVQRVLGLAFLGLMSSCYYLVLGFGLYILLGPLLLGHVVVPTLLLAVWVGQSFVRHGEYEQLPHRLRSNWAFREVVNFFDMTVVMEQRLDPTREYLFAQHPHGVIPLASFLSAFYIADVLPGKQVFCCIHSGIFHLPFIRHVLGALGAVPANRENIAAIKQLKASCSVVVGGVSEMFLQRDHVQVVKLRKGFIREALRHGYSLCPMFHYGNDRLYRFLGGPQLWSRLSRGLPFPLFLAYGGLLGPLLPFRTPLLTAIGTPLDPAALLGLEPGQVVECPSEEAVQAVYEAFKAQLVDHYYKHRPDWETRELHVIDAHHHVKTAHHTIPPPPASAAAGQ